MNADYTQELIDNEIARLSKKEQLTEKEQEFVNDYLDTILLKRKQEQMQLECDTLEAQLKDHVKSEKERINLKVDSGDLSELEAKELIKYLEQAIAKYTT